MACFTVHERFAAVWLGTCRSRDSWWWKVVCRFYNVLWDVCQELWPSSAPCHPSAHSIHVNNFHRATLETLWYQIWMSRASELKTHLYKTDLNWISNNLAMWFGSDLQKSDFVFLLFRLNKINLNKIFMCQKSDLSWQFEHGHAMFIKHKTCLKFVTP